MKILITGGSHVVALNQGFKQLTESGEVPKELEFVVRPLGGGLSVSRNFFRSRGDHVEITDPKFRAKFRRIPPPGSNYDAIVLSTALYSRPIWNKSDWAVYGVAGVSNDRIMISNHMLRRVIHDDNKFIIEFLRQLRAFGMQVCVVEGPRPFRHNVEVQRAGIDLVEYIDSQYRSLTLETLSREEIPAILVPDFVFDENGFMLPKYRHKNASDKTHGNVDFGAVMMRQVIQHFRQAT